MIPTLYEATLAALIEAGRPMTYLELYKAIGGRDPTASVWRGRQERTIGVFRHEATRWAWYKGYQGPRPDFLP